MSYMLVPGMIQETPADADDWYLCRIGIDRGISFLERHDGSIYQKRFPSLDEILDANRTWIGGHNWPIDDATAAEFIAQGYGSYVQFYYPPGSYGSGIYGGGQYGYGAPYY